MIAPIHDERSARSENFALRLAFAVELVDCELEEAPDWDTAVDRIRDGLHELFETPNEYQRFAATAAFRAVARLLWEARSRLQSELIAN
ncbi:MAG: hypothetical protein NXI22_22720 [bacterium]|nr:hypothetical protein [bacterium]